MKIGDIVTPTYSDMELFYGREYIIVQAHMFSPYDECEYVLICLLTGAQLRYWYKESRLRVVKQTLKRLLEVENV